MIISTLLSICGLKPQKDEENIEYTIEDTNSDTSNETNITHLTRCAIKLHFVYFILYRLKTCHSEPAAGGAKNLIPKCRDFSNRWAGDSSLRSE